MTCFTTYVAIVLASMPLLFMLYGIVEELSLIRKELSKKRRL